jgi:hypothetical protein
MEQAEIDKDYLERIISRYGMEQLWNQWKDQILLLNACLLQKKGAGINWPKLFFPEKVQIVPPEKVFKPMK